MSEVITKITIEADGEGIKGEITYSDDSRVVFSSLKNNYAISQTIKNAIERIFEE